MEILARGCADGVPSRLYPKTVVVGSAGVLRVPVFDLNMQTRDHDSCIFESFEKKGALYATHLRGASFPVRFRRFIRSSRYIPELN